jgi:hypothetical protein
MPFSPGKTILLLVVLLVICGSIILAQKKSAALATPHISGGYANSALLPLFAIRAAAKDLAARQREDERHAAAVQQEN